MGGGSNPHGMLIFVSRVGCHCVLSLIVSLLLAPRSSDSDVNRKTPLDTTHTRGEQRSPWPQTPVIQGGVTLDIYQGMHLFTFCLSFLTTRAYKKVADVLKL